MASNSQPTQGSELQWKVTFQGNIIYEADCKRDALIIVSSESLQGPDIVPRRDAELTEEDIRKLQRLDIPGSVEQWKDDATIMKARCEKDKDYDQVTVKRGETKQSALEACELLLKNTNKAGVDIYYYGPGKRNTGDWCFEDGYITFRDLSELYCSYFKGRMMDICTDCSYSGHWAKELVELMEEQGVKPCGHSVQEKGILINVGASCRSYEIPYCLLYTIRGYTTDKNTGTLMARGPGFEVVKDQHLCAIFSTVIRCAAESIKEPCTLLPDQIWQRLLERDRLELMNNGSEWFYFLLDEDGETIKKFLERKGTNQPLYLPDYGKVLKSGQGRDPPNDVKELFNKMYCF